MSNEQQPRRSAPKKVLEFPEEKRVQALPSPEVPESSIEQLPHNVFSLEEKRKAVEQKAKLQELRTDLRDLPGDEFDENGEYTTDETLDDQIPYHQSFPNARPNFIPALPQKSTPPHSLFQRFDEWSKKLFGFLWKE